MRRLIVCEPATVPGQPVKRFGWAAAHERRYENAVTPGNAPVFSAWCGDTPCNEIDKNRMKLDVLRDDLLRNLPGRAMREKGSGSG
ncbi:hypothetical protein [Blastomonas fulva]|uniref:hypothetical protein n=1 Tax=Blastomonas fulva TaxID=1550728 RepID=UPI003F71CDC3